jgi:hypothetical protein
MHLPIDVRHPHAGGQPTQCAGLESEAKITRDEVKKIVFDSTIWGWSNTWLDRYYEELSAEKKV